MHNINKIFYILREINLVYLLFIFFLTLINTILELIGIGLIIPILGIFVGQNGSNELSKLFSFFELTENIESLLFFFVLFNLVYFFKFIVSISSIFIRNKFFWSLYKNLSNKVFKNYICKNYLSHSAIHSSEKINTIRGEANLFSFGVIMPMIELLIDIVLLFSITAFLFFYNANITFFIIIFFILIGYLWNKFFNKILIDLGKTREKHAKKTISEIQNSFGNFRETVLFGLRKFFLERFKIHNEKFSSVGVKRDTIMQIPRYLLELLSITSILILLYFLLINDISLQEILIILGVFVFSILRMLPSVTKIIRSIQTIKFNNIVVEKIYDNLKIDKNLSEKLSHTRDKNFDFKALSIKELNFKYQGSENFVLKNLNLNILKGEKIGIIGGTGSGKSTLINIISGLINVGENLKINNEKLNSQKIISWQSVIGYVPHDVFLLDETIGYNITLKKDYKFEKDKIIDLLEKVELNEFVQNLPDRIDTTVGEKGNNLSRGQLQRLGIARALYNNPQVIIFDEATSALDVETENLILEKIYKNTENLTIISISHRKSALELCDKVYEIRDGILKKIEQFN